MSTLVSYVTALVMSLFSSNGAPQQITEQSLKKQSCTQKYILKNKTLAQDTLCITYQTACKKHLVKTTIV